MLELTAGKVVALHDSPLGFRHGPKSVVDETTLSVLYLSDDAVTRRYELDLLRELYRDRKGSKLLCVANTADEAVTSSCDSCIELNFGKALPNALMALGYITVAQVVALQRSLSLGITPDNPCPTGEVNRVVKGVTIYPL